MKNQNQSEQELLKKHSPLVSALVNRFVSATPQACSANHLHGLGLIALLDAARSYPATSSVPFETFARIQIQSALLGEIRRAKRWFTAAPAPATFIPYFA
jgi:RNA polymerase sigma factor for flagellar operon FliA